MRVLSYLFALLIIGSLAWADSSFVAPTTVGTAAVGQVPGTTTNDNAAAGKVGEYLVSGTLQTGGVTVTITIASPAVVTWTTNPYYTRNGDGATPVPACGSAITFTTSGALPTGIVSGTTYYVTCGGTLSANTFQISTTIDNAIAGTSINTSGSQSGTQTGTSSATLATGTGVDVSGLALTAGDWDAFQTVSFIPGATTSITELIGAITKVSANQTTSNVYSKIDITTSANVIGGTTIYSSSPVRISVSGTTTVYCMVRASFSISTMAANSFCQARRMR